MMSRVEVLLALQSQATALRARAGGGASARDRERSMSPRSPSRGAELVAALAEHGKALCARTDPHTGRLRQLVNESGSFLETSATAMTAWALAAAANAKILDDRDKTLAWLQPCVHRLWKGVAQVVDATGAVSGVCQGGPIYRNKSDYFARPHAYVASACGGVGAVLRAAAAMHVYEQRP